MRRLILAALLALSTFAHAATLSEFFEHLDPQRHAGLLMWQDTRQWVSEWISDGLGNALWRDPNVGTSGSVEHWMLRNGYLMISGFDQWPADCIKAQLVDINSGATAELDCTNGHYYTPWLLPRDPWRIRIWGSIAASVRFFWEADFYPTQQETNPCWYQGEKTLEVVREQEVWWDANGGWVRGTGTPPFDKFGKPIPTTVVKQSETTLAKGIGVWTLTDLVTHRKMCAYSVWVW